MTSLSGKQGGYQGYPYTNPTVTEVQSVDPSTASRWSNLPRNQITGTGANQNRNSTSIHGSSRSDHLNISTKKEGYDGLSMNVHKKLPIITPDQINQRRNEMRRVQNNSGYQGYPYRNHTVTEVQSVDPETASRWSNLPRNQRTDGRAPNQNRGSSIPEHLNMSKKKEIEDELSMNVYIDLPIINPDEINQRQNETRRVQNNSGYQGYPYRNPIVTDVQSVDPETALKWANLPRKPITDGRENQNRNTLGHGPPKSDQKSNDEEPPMNIYIDLPIIDPHEMNARRDEARSGETNSGFVEDTIFYDPFEDRRINVSRNQGSQITDTPGSIPGPSGSEARTPIAGSSSGPEPISQDTSQSRVPSLMSKETYIYGSRTEDDSFPLSPIPVSEFPEPPPAYSEVDRRIDSEPPRTIVVVPDRTAAVGIASGNRKLLFCPHCGLQVNTLPIREVGALTHVLALIFLFIFPPITLLIYCTNFCKYKNHYCPNCNQLIGYEVPILCQDMIYNKP